MRVVWTAQGNRALEAIMTCAQQFYSRNLLRKLNTDIKDTERLMADNPRMGGLELQANGRDYEYRSIVLCRPFKLIYFIYEDCLYIADVWDTRQLPETLVKHLL